MSNSIGTRIKILDFSCGGGNTHKHNDWFLVIDKSDLTSSYEMLLPARSSKTFCMNIFSKTLSSLFLNEARCQISRELKYIYLKKKAQAEGI